MTTAKETTDQKAERLVADKKVFDHPKSTSYSIHGDTGLYFVTLIRDGVDGTPYGGICIPIRSDYEGHGREYVVFDGHEKKPCSHIKAARLKAMGVV